MEIYLLWVSKLKSSIEVDACFSQTMVNKVLIEVFYMFQLQQNLAQQYGFLNRQASQYNSMLDWSRDEFCQSLYENPGPKTVLFVSKAIITIY